MFSKLGVVPASLRQVFFQKVRFLLKVCCPKRDLEAEQRLVCLQTAFLWLCSSSSSNDRAPWAAYDPLHPHSFPEKKKKRGLPVPCTPIVLFLVPAETHNLVHFYWVSSYSIQTGCSTCQVPSLNCSHVSPRACRLLGLGVTPASGQLGPSLTPPSFSRRIQTHGIWNVRNP